jgi:hypothetical protein
MQELYLRPVLEELRDEYEYPELEQSIYNWVKKGILFDDQEILHTKTAIKAALGLLNMEPDNTKAVLFAFRDVLTDMGLIDYVDINVVNADGTGSESVREYFITQSGLMYYLALVSQDSVFNNVTKNDKLLENIENVVKRRILEMTVIRDTKLKYPKSKVTVLRGERFEIDMVIMNISGDIGLYEIKHSSKAENDFSKKLRDPRLPQFLKQVYGITEPKSCAVLYRGQTTIKQNISFMNVHDFLVK